ncbi:MAG: Crp/Fnr family transcriptional regulator [Deltaproteobacteria bacterium]|nr:Crp/Fnr family transcriptional regulator [Candidatus Zymogenaceae bacterium]
MEKINVLKQIPIFANMGQDELSGLAEKAIRKKFKRDTIIVSEGDDGDSLMIILSGQVKVTLLSEDGKEIILSILREGDFFGEMSLLDGEPRSATVIAMKESTLLIIQRQNFLKQIDENPGLAKAILVEMSMRIRRADRRIGGLVLLDVYGRVATYLLELASVEGKKVEGGILIEKRPTQQEIASMLGASRETVSRVLNDFSRRGIIIMDGKSIMIKGPKDVLDEEIKYMLLGRYIDL